MSPVEDPFVRVGGMAFGNGVLMRGPHYWAWAVEGGEVFHAPVRTLLRRHRVFRVPVIRSMVALIEMMALMFSLYRRSGVRYALRFLGVLAVAMAFDLGLGLLVPYAVHGILLANLVTAVLVFAFGITAMRLGLGRKVWQYHGAEHKAVNAYEDGADLRDLAQVARHSRVHDRCGTNLAVIALFLTLMSYFVLESLPFLFGAVYALLVIAVALEFFRLIGRRPSSTASRALLAGGKALQRRVTTSEPAPQHLEVACAALRRVLDLEAGLA